MQITEQICARFWAKVDKSAGPDGCWWWTGAIDRYGMFRVGDKTHRTHRVAWAIERGPIPEGMCVCHHCDREHCVNPAHLFLGTHGDNSDDKVRKRRHAYGERHPLAKLTEGNVREIRRLRRSGATSAEIAARYGLSVSYAQQLLAGKYWAHITATGASGVLSAAIGYIMPKRHRGASVAILRSLWGWWR